MLDLHTHFAGSIPENYDRYFGPVKFEPYAVDLAQRVAGQTDGPVLEVACGTGILTRQLRAQLPLSVHITATDLNQPMVDYARWKLGKIENVEWRQADFLALPFHEETFDCVVCQFGVMFLPDKSAAFREARRVLVDDGVFAFNVWGDLEHNPYAKLAHETLAKFFPSDPPGFFNIPYGYNDAILIHELLNANGFDQIQSEFVTLDAVSVTAHGLAIGLLQGTPASNAIKERGADFEPLIEALTEGLVQLGGDNPFRTTMQALVVTARKCGTGLIESIATTAVVPDIIEL